MWKYRATRIKMMTELLKNQLLDFTPDLTNITVRMLKLKLSYIRILDTTLKTES